MSATLYQVAGAVVPPVADARLYHLLLGQTGVVEGCEITSLGGTVLHIADGWGVVQGRVWSISAQYITATASTSGTVKGRLLLRLDTSLEARSAAQLITQAAATLPSLTQEDLLSGGSVYELPLATYSVGEVNIEGLAVSFSAVTSPWAAATNAAAAVESITAEKTTDDVVSVSGVDVSDSSWVDLVSGSTMTIDEAGVYVLSIGINVSPRGLHSGEQSILSIRHWIDSGSYCHRTIPLAYGLSSFDTHDQIAYLTSGEHSLTARVYSGTKVNIDSFYIRITKLF